VKFEKEPNDPGLIVDWLVLRDSFTRDELIETPQTVSRRSGKAAQTGGTNGISKIIW